MNILSKDIDEFDKSNILFSRICVSTNSVDGRIIEEETGEFSIMEEEFIKIVHCTKNIVTIDCNYGHKVWPGFNNAQPKKSKKGKKPAEKKKRKRKIQGDGSSFSSQITFGVLGTCERKISKYYANEPKKDYKITKISKKLERIEKVYKIKVFRNGVLSIPGSLSDDLSDVRRPIEILCEHLSEVMGKKIILKPGTLRNVMKNCKFVLKNKHVDLTKLGLHFNEVFDDSLFINPEDIMEFLCNPTFENEISPASDGWGKVIEDGYKEYKLDYGAMQVELENSTKICTTHIKFDNLKDVVEKRIDYKSTYQKCLDVCRKFDEKFNVTLTDKFIECLIGMQIQKFAKRLRDGIKMHKDNEVSGIRYDPNTSQAFIIEINSPIEDKKDKNTTIKIFRGRKIKTIDGVEVPAAKINIDGANNLEEVEKLYYWLNDLLLKNPSLLSDPNMVVDDLDPDDEFSYTDEDD